MKKKTRVVDVTGKKLKIARVVSVEAKLSSHCPKASQNVCGINYRQS